MIKEVFSIEKRELSTVQLKTDFVITGGGLSGVCAAIAAARSGIKVVLIQDRPVLGGNASSEIRLWILGATSHMGNNNRWSREGGIIDEILVENIYRNKEGNPILLDTVILEKVMKEKNIILLLNTAVYNIEKEGKSIRKVMAFCSQNQTFYNVEGTLFCDASGDGVVAYMAGASFRIGAEDELVYGERFAPDTKEYGDLLGHSIYFYSKDIGKPVKFVAPEYALKEISRIPRIQQVRADEHGCKYWWLEYGGRLDTIHQTEDIKWELWRVVYGVWDYIKNSGKFPEAENLTLEWVGIIPGKRESRRFLGYYTLKQQDIVEQTHFEDAIAFGGWAIDLHPADGVYSEKEGCIQYHSKGVYEIPYRCFVSKDINNLFFAGRNISTSHVAHGSSRVMATSAFGGQAVGVAAAQCIRKGLLPENILGTDEMNELQQSLNIMGQSIPYIAISPKNNKACLAKVEASSQLVLNHIPFDGPWNKLDFSTAQMLPLSKNEKYTFTIQTKADKDTVLDVELRCSIKPGNYTPDLIVDKQRINVHKGVQNVNINFSKGLPISQYGFITFLRNDSVEIRMSEERYTGIVSVFNKFNKAVNNNGKQIPPPNTGIEAFEFWCPDRRPKGNNIAMRFYPGIDTFAPINCINGYIRPTTMTNAWVASMDDKSPTIEYTWDTLQTINRLHLYFDTDYDHAMESVQLEHPENVMPFCVRTYQIIDKEGVVLFEKKDNHQTINVIDLNVQTDCIKIKLEQPLPYVPAALFQIYIE